MENLENENQVVSAETTTETVAARPSGEQNADPNEGRIVAIEQRLAEVEGKTAKLESENESLHKRLDSLTDELEQQKKQPAAPAEGADKGELEEKIAKLEEFLGPHGHNRVIPEVVEPQCQSEIAEPQPE